MTTTALRSLFNHVEQLRLRARLSQVDVAELIGVTRRTYIDWRKGVDMQPERESALRYAKFIIEQGMARKDLPIVGHDRRPDTATSRREVIRELMKCYPVNPFAC